MDVSFENKAINNFKIYAEVGFLVPTYLLVCYHPSTKPYKMYASPQSDLMSASL